MTHSDNTPAGLADQGDWEITRCPLIDPGDLVRLRPVQPGDPAAIVAALRTAREMAEALRAQLARIGGGAEDTLVTPLLNDEGQPVVRVRMTVAGARRLRRWLATECSDPPDADESGADGTRVA